MCIATPESSASSEKRNLSRSSLDQPNPQRQASLFERVFHVAEFLSFVAIIVAGPVAIFEIKNFRAESAAAARAEQEAAKKERFDFARGASRLVNDEFGAFTKLCFENPRLDCYSIALTDEQKPPLSPLEKIQQKVLYSALTDAFEIAYTNNNPEIKDLDPEVRKIFADQWNGWDAYIRKFLARPAYCQVYLEIRDEYDSRLVAHMNQIAPCAQRAPKSAGASQSDKLAPHIRHANPD